MAAAQPWLVSARPHDLVTEPEGASVSLVEPFCPSRQEAVCLCSVWSLCVCVRPCMLHGDLHGVSVKVSTHKPWIRPEQGPTRVGKALKAVLRLSGLSFRIPRRETGITL